MKYYLDSAKLDEIDYAYKFYKIDGVTTNPKHIMNSGKPFLKAINDIADWLKKNKLEGKEFPISVEINPHLNKHEDMIKEAKKIAKISKNFIIKIPCNSEGIKAAKLLEDSGIRTNVTLVFSTSQAIQAGRINARFVSPFIGWKESSGEDGLSYIKQICNIYKNKKYKTEIICAAVRTGYQIAALTEMGADIITAGLAVYEESFNDPWTNKGLKNFQDAWDNTKGN